MEAPRLDGRFCTAGRGCATGVAATWADCDAATATAGRGAALADDAAAVPTATAAAAMAALAITIVNLADVRLGVLVGDKSGLLSGTQCARLPPMAHACPQQGCGGAVACGRDAGQGVGRYSVAAVTHTGCCRGPHCPTSAVTVARKQKEKAMS